MCHVCDIYDHRLINDSGDRYLISQSTYTTVSEACPLSNVRGSNNQYHWP